MNKMKLINKQRSVLIQQASAAQASAEHEGERSIASRTPSFGRGRGRTGIAPARGKVLDLALAPVPWNAPPPDPPE